MQALLQEHVAEAGSPAAEALLAAFDPGRFVRVATRLSPSPSSRGRRGSAVDAALQAL